MQIARKVVAEIDGSGRGDETQSGPLGALNRKYERNSSCSSEILTSIYTWLIIPKITV
jgi:hypothetical protein